MDHHQPHHQSWFVVAIVAALALAPAAGPSCAHAQSLNNSDSSAAGSPITEPSLGSSAESDNGAEAEANPPDGTGESADGSAAYRASHDPDAAAIPIRGAVAPDEESGSASNNDAVLEIPQVINPSNAGAPDQSANAEQANGGGNEDEAGQASQAGGQTAADEDDLAAEANQVGTLQDYQNQASAAPLGPVFFAPGIRIVQFPRLPALNGLSRHPTGIPMAGSPIILPPTSSGPFPSTSPMLMAPRTNPMLMAPRIGTLGAFPRAGLMGFRR